MSHICYLAVISNHRYVNFARAAKVLDLRLSRYLTAHPGPTTLSFASISFLGRPHYPRVSVGLYP